MRRPKAAIPILPPPDNQYQPGRGRGRSTQQQQQTNQPGCLLHIEQEAKPICMEGSQNNVPETFDNTQIEQTTDIQEEQSNNVLSTVTNTAVDDTDKDIQSLDINVPESSPDTNKEELDKIDLDDSLKVTINEQDIISIKTPETVIEKTEIDSNKTEAIVTESFGVEEAAA